MPDQSGRLDSWKDIARHLGRDVSTVMRWERERGLPIHRLPGAKRSGVFAYREELDAWLAQHPGTNGESPTTEASAHARSSNLLWIGTAAFILAGIGLVATLVSNAGQRPVADLIIERNELRARDAEGRVLWVHHIDAVASETPSGRWTYIGDLDADGQAEIIAVVKTQRTAGAEVIDEMLSFSEDGRLRWRRVPNTRLRFADGEYGPPWTSEDLLAFESNGETRLPWAVRHYTWWPSMLLVLDGTGAERGRFVNSGWIRTLAVSQDARTLMASGISNEYGATFLALLDSARIAGSSPEGPDSKYACRDCGSERPLQYFVVPRTDVSELATFPPLHPPVIQTFADGAVQMRVSENSESPPAEMIYEFSPGYALQRARFSDSFWTWHRRLEAEGILRHRAEECPERQGLEVKHWTPANGWLTMHVPAL